MADILDKMTLYVNHKNDQNANNSIDKDIVNIIRNNLVKRRQLNAKIYAHNMAVRARKHKPNTIKTSEPNTIKTSEPNIIEPLQKQPDTTSRRKPRVIMDKSVITNNIIF
jgi:hypothetical protein